MYTIYDALTGKITGVMVGVSRDLAEAYGCLYGGVVDDERHYIRNNDLVSRPTMAPIVEALGPNFIISNLPPNATIIVEDQQYKIFDGKAEMTFSMPGTYRCLVQCFPYQDQEVILENPAP